MTGDEGTAVHRLVTPGFYFYVGQAENSGAQPLSPAGWMGTAPSACGTDPNGGPMTGAGWWAPSDHVEGDIGQPSHNLTP